MLNKLVISGYLTKDAETFKTSDKELVKFTIGNTYAKDKTLFIESVVFGSLVDFAKSLVKGQKIVVVGTLVDNSYKAKDGTSRSKTQIVVDTIEVFTK